MSIDLFNLDSIYDQKFTYSLPRKVLEGFSKGIGFPENTVEYTPEEFALLKQDIQDIWDDIMSKKPAASGDIVLTAGAPGVGKTTLVRQLWGKQDGYAYTCPDDVCLREMKRTYQVTAATDGLKKAYEKWRGASNFAHHLITARLIQNHFNFYFGTTASSPMTGLFLDFLKKNGYSITILHVTAPDQVRFDSIAARDKVMIQATSQDVLNKQLMVHERIEDTFLKYANRIDFYFRTHVNAAPVLTAIWTPKKLEILDSKAYDEMKALHDHVCDGMKKPDLKWAKTVVKHSL